MNEETPIRVVLDTSILVAAARSRRGASFAILSSLPSPVFHPCLSVGLYTEWQSVLLRPENLPPGETAETAMGALRRLVAFCHLQEIHFLWRPFLSDPEDEFILELAFAAHAHYIVTHNTRDFAGCERLGVTAITPRDFLTIIRKSS
jgi:predicted nucleic acid-binding protein